MKYPEKPDINRRSLPDHRRACPECGDDRDYWERKKEREELGNNTDRMDYWCPECDEHVGTKVDYHGPVPVEIGPGVYELQ